MFKHAYSNLVVVFILIPAVVSCGETPTHAGDPLEPAHQGVSQRGPTQGYTVISLSIPPLPGGARAEAIATAINDNGVIVGSMYTQEGPIGLRWDRARPDEPEFLPFGPSKINNRGDMIGGAQVMRRSGEVVDLVSLPNGGHPVARDINNAGHVVGTSQDEGGRLRPVIWRHFQDPMDLGTPQGASGADAFAINERGDVIGRAFMRETEDLVVIWTNSGGMLTFELPEFEDSFVIAGMNSRREFVGNFPGSWLIGDPSTGPLRQGADGRLTGINEKGEVAAASDEIQDGAGVFTYPNESDITVLPNGDVCPRHQIGIPRDINNRGDVVGFCSDGIPVLWVRDRGS